MAEIKTFTPKKKPKPRVYVCNCGNENFWLYEDGQIECCECNLFHEDMTGYWKLIDPNPPAAS